MSFLEKTFQKIAQQRIFRKRQSPGHLRLRDLVKHLDVFANSFCQTSSQVHCMASRDFVGLNGSQLLLPEVIDRFEDATLNKNLYQNLILQVMGARLLRLTGAIQGQTSTGSRLKFLEQSYSVNHALDDLLPGYQAFQLDLVGRVEALTGLRRGYQKQIFDFWRERVSARVPVRAAADSLIRNVRSQDAVPEFMFLTVPCLEAVKASVRSLGNQKEGSHKKQSQNETEVEKTYSGINQEVDLEKEQANPIMHSFEKLETADEYSGGRTMDSGEDELSDHSSALDELNLTKVTRGGEASKSVFNAETFIEFAVPQHELDKHWAKGYLYPEWNFKKNVYMNDHCHLLENPLEIAAGSEEFRNYLLTKNRFQIGLWQSRIQSLFSEPLWLRKLTEGDEIDIDEVIRDFGSLLSRRNISARWYMNRKKILNDVEIVVLFDQSHSSDSWIGNRRVLDISLEAVGTAGLLFDQLFDSVTVAGMWSSTRSHCSFQIYKSRSEPWSAFFTKKHAIQPQGYTRLGPAIRHAIALLKGAPHTKKLILLLTDGKPTDVDGYEGLMGISDVAQACREAESNGILHYALILDQKQKTHFAKMFKHYVLLHDPKLFSEELFKILFRLIRLS